MNITIGNKYSEILQTLNIDVIKSLNGEFTPDEIAEAFTNFFYQRMIIDITAIKNYTDIRNIEKLFSRLDRSKMIFYIPSEENIDKAYLSKFVNLGVYNFTSHVEEIPWIIDNPKAFDDVSHYREVQQVKEVSPIGEITRKDGEGPTIIGFKNITEHAGASSLIFMFKMELARKFNVVGLEIDRIDFENFNDPNMISTTTDNLTRTLKKYENVDIILVDLNSMRNLEICNEVIYLIEPSTLKLNKLMKFNGGILAKLEDKKVILNKSMVDSKDITQFERESRLNVFFNIPPLDERRDNSNIFVPLMSALGLTKRTTSSDGEKKKGFGIFKF